MDIHRSLFLIIVNLILLGTIYDQAAEASQPLEAPFELNSAQIVDLLKKGKADLKYPESKKAIFVFGNPGAGKSALVQFITGHLNSSASIGKLGMIYIVITKFPILHVA